MTRAARTRAARPRSASARFLRVSGLQLAAFGEDLLGREARAGLDLRHDGIEVSAVASPVVDADGGDDPGPGVRSDLDVSDRPETAIGHLHHPDFGIVCRDAGRLFKHRSPRNGSQLLGSRPSEPERKPCGSGGVGPQTANLSSTDNWADAARPARLSHRL